MPTKEKDEIETLQDKLAVESQAVVNDLFKKVLSVEDEEYSLTISGFIEESGTFHWHDYEPYDIVYIHNNPEKDSVYATLRVQKGVEL